jgi:hypothetical protein
MWTKLNEMLPNALSEEFFLFQCKIENDVVLKNLDDAQIKTLEDFLGKMPVTFFEEIPENIREHVNEFVENHYLELQAQLEERVSENRLTFDEFMDLTNVERHNFCIEPGNGYTYSWELSTNELIDIFLRYDLQQHLTEKHPAQILKTTHPDLMSDIPAFFRHIDFIERYCHSEKDKVEHSEKLFEDKNAVYRISRGAMEFWILTKFSNQKYDEVCKFFQEF